MNAGTWVAGPVIPNSDAPVDAPAAMMVNGIILCCEANTNNSYGSGSVFYEYNYIANTFTQITSPTGGSSSSEVAYGTAFLDLPAMARSFVLVSAASFTTINPAAVR